MADKFTIKFDAQMEIGQLKAAINQIQQEFKKIQIPQNATKPLTNTLEQLSKEIDNFEKLTSKSVGSKADFGKIEKSSQHLLDLWEKLNKSYEDLTSLSDNKLKKLFPEEISNNIKKAVTALKDYEKQTGEIDDNIKKIENSLKKAQEAQEKLTKDIEKENSKKIVDTEGFNNFKKEIQATEKELSEYKKKLEEVNNFIAEKESTLKEPKKSHPYGRAIKQAKELGETIAEVQEKLDNLYNDSTSITTKEQHVKELAKINEKYQETSAEVQEFSKQLKEAEKSGIDNSNKAFNALAETLKGLLGLDISNLGTDSKEVGKAIEQYITNKVNQMRQSVDNAKPPIQNFGQVVQEAANKTHAFGEEVREFDQRAKEIDGIKSRITAFFGLNNAIMLARRALRSAFNTVKELDKAMTETAVVTNFSVGDMWSQLPEYTKRANELGVTTLEAYQASTLFYQQGLKTNEVVALSNETLKMARIAGLDAAEATDRMTNALRGFNMTLTETNAQRIDDVYSKLAAITASNVDEISTAMTKVASLAHNANMEFETTSAFLAQIIETTRESAETAGTALKTVVARFSEVKDLYTKEELTGTDEEGEVIDVNKISKALRTAGIDLNRYFLGTAGLDDIFMELAEKWDSLTNVQQRYIATQAAGSRQQSRFIALMSDYARTQELVGAAYNANGAAAEQFEKTQDSLQSKLARLKNAWDEFTMGLANSTLIKTGVDLLTGVLKVINKLTTGFGLLSGNVGNFVSALLKIGTVMAARSIAKGPASMLINSLGSLIGFGGVSNKEAYLRGTLRNDSGAIGDLKTASWGQILKYQYGNGFKNLLNKRKEFLNNSNRIIFQGTANENTVTPTTLFGALGNRFISGNGVLGKAGAGLNKGLINLFGSKSIFAGAAGGAATLGIALAGITAAAVGAYGAIKMLYDASPEGQIKYAEQIKSEIDHTKSSLEATKKTLDETLDSYDQQLDSLSKLEEGTTEWANAFIEVNKTVSDLIERFPKLAAYVTTTSDGLLQLDRKGLAQYQKELNEQIGKYSALSIMATGGVAQRKAIASKEATEVAGQQYLAEASFIAAAKSLTKGQYSQEVYKAFAQNFDFNKWAQEAGRKAGSGTGRFLGIGTGGGTKKELRERYKELTGQEADENWNKNDLKNAIGQLENIQDIESYLENINQLVDSINRKQKSGGEGSENSAAFKDTLAGLFNQQATDMATNLVGQYAGGLSDFELKKIAQGDFAYSSTDSATSEKIYQGFEELLNRMRESTDMSEEEFNAAIKEYYNVDTLVAAGLALYQDIINNTEKFNVAKDTTNKAVADKLGIVGAQSFNDFMNNVGQVSNEIYAKLGEVFAELSLNGVNVAETFKNLTPEAAEFLAQLDISDPDVIRMVINQLDSMGVEIDNKVIDKLIDLADAATAAADALADIDKATNLFKLASELKNRESYVFSGEEYSQYGQYDQEGFYRVSEDLYIYIRDGFDRLIEGLEKEGNKLGQQAIDDLKGNIKIGEEIEKEVEKALEEALNSPASALGKEELIKRIQTRFSAKEWDNYENLEQYKKVLEQTENGKIFYGNNKNLNIKDRDSVAAKFNVNVDKELLTYYDSINDSLEEQDKKTKELLGTEQEREVWAQKIALQYRDTIQEYNNLLSVIEANKDNLLIEDTNSQFYKNAVSEISQEIQKMYGLSEKAADKFVDEHKDAIIAAIESEEGFQTFLGFVAEAWKNSNTGMIQSAATAMGVTVEEVESMLDQIANYLADFDGEIGIDVDTEQVLANLQAAGIDIDSFMKSMGWELVTEQGEPTKVLNPAYDAMAPVLAMSGMTPEQAGIPRYTQMNSTKMMWKRVGAADIENVQPPSPPGGSTPPKTEEPTPVDLAKEAYDTNQTNIDYWEAKGDKEKVKELLLANPGLIMEIVAALRKETGKDFENLYSTEIQENDPNEVIEWLTNWIQAVTEAEEYGKEPEKTEEELAQIERDRLENMILNNESQDKIIEQYKKVIELFRKLYEDAMAKGDDFLDEANSYKETIDGLEEELKNLTIEPPRDFQKEISELETSLELIKLQGATPEEQAEIINQIQAIYEAWIEYLRNSPDYTGKDDEEIKKLQIAVLQLEEQEKELLTPPPEPEPEVVTWLIDPDRYYNLNNLIERLIDTGEDLSESLQKSLGDADSSGNQILKNFVSLLDAYLKELQSEKYKGEALRIDRDTLDTQFADVFAAGLVERLEDGTLVNLVENIEQLEADDQELYERYEDFMSKNDDIENNIKSNEDAIKNVQNKIEDLKNTYEQLQSAYIDLVKRVVDAIVTLQQEAIDTQKEIYSSLNETARNILDGMREQIALERQIRDNTKTEEEIKDLESRLAYLRRDTTGANAQEILKLEKQIEQKREGYQDKLVDQRLQELQKQQQEEEKNRNKQIEAMQETLNEQVKQGAFNNQAEEIIAGAIDENGKIISNSELVELLGDAENWDTLTDEQRAQIDQALDKEVNLAAAWLMSKDGGFAKFAKDYLGEESPLYQWLTGGKSENNLPALFDAVVAAAEGITEKYAEVSGTLNGIEQKLEIQKNGESNNDGSSAYNDGSSAQNNDSSQERYAPLLNRIKREAFKHLGRDLDDYLTKQEEIYPWFNRSMIGYASGGLNTKTGPAWLDGTPSNPEYVLNAAQTQAFLRLAEVLPSIMRGNTPNNEDSIKNIYLNLTMNVDEIGNDYDVDKIVKRVKEVLYEAGTYRNVNMLSLN